MQHGLQLLAPYDQRSQQQGHDGDGQGIEPGQPGHDDAVVAIAHGQALLKTEVDAAHFGHAGDTGQGAAEQHDADDLTFDPEAGVAGGLRIETDGPHPVTPAGVAQGSEEEHRQNEGQDEPQMNAGAEEMRDAGGFGQLGGARKPVSLGVAPGSEIEVFHHNDGDVVEQQRRENFVDGQKSFQDAGYQGPQGATGRPGRTNVAYLLARDRHTPLILPFEEGSVFVENGESGSGVERTYRAKDVIIASGSDPFVPPERDAWDGVERAGLDTVLSTSDVVSLHVPLNDSTQGLVDAQKIRRMRPGAVLINTARGGTVDEAVKTAQTIADMSRPIAMMTKESVNRSYETTLAEGLLFERRMFHALFATEDQTEGMAAFLDKREAQFRDK